jgi:hypothetical protein
MNILSAMLEFNTNNIVLDNRSFKLIWVRSTTPSSQQYITLYAGQNQKDNSGKPGHWQAMQYNPTNNRKVTRDLPGGYCRTP